MNAFDADRQGTGTKEWAEVTENIQRGCINDCLYCYAAHNANRFGYRKRDDWAREELTKRAAIGSGAGPKALEMNVTARNIERGGIVGIAEIVDCVTRSDSRWFVGPYGFVLRNVEPLPFYPCKGALGFFKPGP